MTDLKRCAPPPPPAPRRSPPQVDVVALSYFTLAQLPLPLAMPPTTLVLGQAVPNATFRGHHGKFTGYVVEVGGGGSGGAEGNVRLRYTDGEEHVVPMADVTKRLGGNSVKY